MTGRRRVLLAVVALSILVGGHPRLACAAGSVNYLRNPGFEEDGGWEAFTADENDLADPGSTLLSHTGNRSAYVKATTIGGDGYAFVSQEVSIPIQRFLEFSFWLYVGRSELPFRGYVKGFVATAAGRFFDVGVWSDSPKPRQNEYHLKVALEYDRWFKVDAAVGELWVEEAKFPENDTITSVGLGIYNALVYALPENLLQLEVFFDDIFLGQMFRGEIGLLRVAVTATAMTALGLLVLTVARRRLRSGIQKNPVASSLLGAR